MSRKDYIAFAAIIKAQIDNTPDLLSGEYIAGRTRGIVNVAKDYAKLAASQNPRFNAITFYQACGITL